MIHSSNAIDYNEEEFLIHMLQRKGGHLYGVQNEFGQMLHSGHETVTEGTLESANI